MVFTKVDCAKCAFCKLWKLCDDLVISGNILISYFNMATEYTSCWYDDMDGKWFHGIES